MPVSMREGEIGDRDVAFVQQLREIRRIAVLSGASLEAFLTKTI
jgi:hypothetical protein